MSSKALVPVGYGDFLIEVKTQIRQRQLQALRAMRQLFNEYSDKPKLQSLIGEISWAKNLLIMARCKDVGRVSAA